MIGGQGGLDSHPVEPVPGTLGHVLAAIDAYAARHVPAGPSEVADELVHLRQGIDRLELRFSRSAGRLAASSHWDDEGFISPYQWIRVTCKMGGGAAGQRITVGQHQESLTQSTAALERGEIGFNHLTQIASLLRTLTESKLPVVFNEKLLLDKARDLTVREFAKFCDLARSAMDPKGHELSQKDQTERQSFWMKQAEDGMWLGKFLLNNENGAATRTLIDALSKKNGVGDDRALALREAWALAEAVNHCLRTMDLPTTGQQVPHLQVTASIESLLAALGAPGAQLQDGHPINAEALRRVACDCAVSRTLLRGDSTVLEMGQWARTVSPSLRRALVLRDQRCQWPGCDRHASWAEAHHVVAWVDGGPTTKENLVLLCLRHHYLVHEGKWILVVKGEDREVVVIPPTYRCTAAA